MQTTQDLRAKAALLIRQADETPDRRYRILLQGLACDLLSVANQRDGVTSLHAWRTMETMGSRTDLDRPARLG